MLSQNQLLISFLLKRSVLIEYIIMEKTESNIERNAEQVNHLKTQITIKVANLHEQLCKRNELEHQLYDLQADIKSIKTVQCALRQKNTNQQWEQQQIVKNISSTNDEIMMTRNVIQAVSRQLSDKQKNNLNLQQKIVMLRQTGQILQIRQSGVQNNIKIAFSQIEALKQSEEDKITILKSQSLVINKLKEQAHYYLKRQNQILNMNKQTNNKILNQNEVNLTIQHDIVQKQRRQKQLTQQQNKIDKDIYLLSQNIQNQLMNNRIIKQKLTIIKQRMNSIQSAVIKAQNSKQQKDQEHKLKLQKKRQLLKRWMNQKNKIIIDIEYSKRFIDNKLEFIA